MREVESLGVHHGDISVIANDAHGKHAGHPGGVGDHGDVTRGISAGAVLGVRAACSRAWVCWRSPAWGR